MIVNRTFCQVALIFHDNPEFLPQSPHHPPKIIYFNNKLPYLFSLLLRTNLPKKSERKTAERNGNGSKTDKISKQTKSVLKGVFE